MAGDGWACFEKIDGKLHVIPLNDWLPHAREDCMCRPHHRADGMITHNAFDWRELVEDNPQQCG